MDVDRFREWIRDTQSEKRRRSISLSTVNHYHASLKAIIQWGIKRRLFFGLNPAWGVDMAKVPRARCRYLLPDEERRLTPCVAKRSRLWPFYAVALHTGMRIGEILTTTVENVITHPKPMIFVPNPKNSRSRYVPLYGISAELMARAAHNKPPHSLALDPWSYQAISDWLEEALEEAQIKNFSFHCLRHTFAAHMLARGVPIYVVSKILGHSSVKVTEDHYGHLDKSVLFGQIHHIGDVMTLPTGLPSMPALTAKSLPEQDQSEDRKQRHIDEVFSMLTDVPSNMRQTAANEENVKMKMFENYGVTENQDIA